MANKIKVAISLAGLGALVVTAAGAPAVLVGIGAAAAVGATGYGIYKLLSGR